MKRVGQFDELLNQLGTGLWNVPHFIISAYFSAMTSMQVYHTVFLAPAISYTCQPHPDHSVYQIANDSCSYQRGTSDSTEELVEESCTEWEYDTSIYNTTLTAEFGLVCGRAYLRATYQSIFTFATLFSCFFAGFLADRFGRKFVVSVSAVLLPICGIIIALVHNFHAILFLRFILGALAVPAAYTLAIEVCPVKHRSAVGILLGMPWALGIVVLGVMAKLIRQWRNLQLALSIPGLLLLLLLLSINESPRWLIVTGRHKRALEELRRAARLNRVTLPPDYILLPMMVQIQSEIAEQDKHVELIDKSDDCNPLAPSDSTLSSPALTYREEQGTSTSRRYWLPKLPKLISTPKIRLVVLLVSVMMFLSSLVYSGLNLSGATYSNDPFLYIMLVGLMEMPGYIFSVPIIHRWGRTGPTKIGYSITGVVILSLTFVPSDISWLVMTLALLGKIFLTGSWMILFVYTAEIFPTEIRVQGLCVTYTTAQISASIAPYFSDFLRPLVPWLPSAIFGVSAFIGSAALIPLPETHRKNLPDTIADLERLWCNY